MTIYYYILIFIIGILIGVLFSNFIFFKKRNNIYENSMNEFKNILNELKFENSIYSNDIKSRLDCANNLSKALTTNQNIKGKFGEESLENILKICYPNKNIDYISQYITKNIDESVIKPDYVVNLPNNNSLIIDCKLNLEKYIEYKNCISSENELIKKHELINDLLSTINNLSNKKYETAKKLSQPNFILMYVPLEPLITLIYTDNDFLNVVKSAYDKNIIIVGNSGILTTIRLVKILWSNKIKNENIDNILNLSKDIYSEISLHSNKLITFKNLINEFCTNFNKEFEKFNSESKIFKLTNKLRDFGINSKIKKVGKKLEDIEIEEEFLK